MNINKLCLFVCLFFVLSPAAAQQSGSGSQDDSGLSEISRPGMEVLFMRPDQRQILEVVRQGFISEEIREEEEDDFAPAVFAEDISSDFGVEEAPPPIVASRVNRYRVDAIIRNRTKDRSSIIVDGKIIPLGRDNTVLKRDGIYAITATDDVQLEGSDSVTNGKFKIKVGQSLESDGFVNEQLPVVVIQ